MDENEELDGAELATDDELDEDLLDDEDLEDDDLEDDGPLMPDADGVMPDEKDLEVPEGFNDAE